MAKLSFHWKKGDDWQESAAKANDFLGAVIPALPMLGGPVAFAATVFFSLVGGLLGIGPSQDDQFRKLYEKIMEEVQDLRSARGIFVGCCCSGPRVVTKLSHKQLCTPA